MFSHIPKINSKNDVTNNKNKFQSVGRVEPGARGKDDTGVPETI